MVTRFLLVVILRVREVVDVEPKNVDMLVVVIELKIEVLEGGEVVKSVVEEDVDVEHIQSAEVDSKFVEG